MLAGKHGHQLRILIQGAKILLVIDLRAIGVQVDGGQVVRLLELLRHLAANLLQTGGADSLLNVASDVLDLAVNRKAVTGEGE